MAKIDLKHAYRSDPPTPQIIRLQAASGGFGGKILTGFYDTRLPFGAESSPKIFHRLTQAVRRMMGKRGFVNIIVYLDNFLVFGATQAECTHASEVVIATIAAGFRFYYQSA